MVIYFYSFLSQEFGDVCLSVLAKRCLRTPRLFHSKNQDYFQTYRKALTEKNLHMSILKLPSFSN